MSKHTPWPWHFDRNRDEVTVYANNDWPVARLLEHNDVANARLIAAAPELLDAMSDLIACCENHPAFTKPSNAITVERMNSARAAIAKAKAGGR